MPVSSVDNRQRQAATGAGHHPEPLLVLAMGALGVVFGDIGTSPLYALQTVFSIDNGAIRPGAAATSTASSRWSSGRSC